MASASGTGTGDTSWQACDAAKEDALENAIAASGGRGVNVCMCDGTPPVDNGDGTWSCWAVICYDYCCPPGYKQVELVTDVRCEDGEIVVDKEKFCVIDDDCTEEC
jgi:hypothetical protein